MKVHYMPDGKELGSFYKRIREGNGWSQTDMPNRTNNEKINQCDISKFESGDKCGNALFNKIDEANVFSSMYDEDFRCRAILTKDEPDSKSMVRELITAYDLCDSWIIRYKIFNIIKEYSEDHIPDDAEVIVWLACTSLFVYKLNGADNVSECQKMESKLKALISKLKSIPDVPNWLYGLAYMVCTGTIHFISHLVDITTKTELSFIMDTCNNALDKLNCEKDSDFILVLKLTTYLNMARYMKKFENYDDALEYANVAKKISKEITDSFLKNHFLFEINEQIAWIFYQKKEYNKAINNTNIHIEYLKKIIKKVKNKEYDSISFSYDNEIFDNKLCKFKKSLILNYKYRITHKNPEGTEYIFARIKGIDSIYKKVPKDDIENYEDYKTALHSLEHSVYHLTVLKDYED